MTIVEYTINNREIICYNEHFDYSGGIQKIPSEHDIFCTQLIFLNSRIKRIISAIEYLEENYKCSSDNPCNNIEINKIGDILAKSIHAITHLDKQITSYNYDMAEVMLLTGESINTFKALDKYSVNNLHEAFEKNAVITTKGWIGASIFAIGAIGIFLICEDIKIDFISGISLFTTVSGLVLTAAAAYQYHNEITHRIADINNDLVQLNGVLESVNNYVDAFN